MIKGIRGLLTKKNEGAVYITLGGFCYEINIPKTVYLQITQKPGEEVDLVIYHYMKMEKNKAVPVMIGFIEELERDFFEKFISVSGIGPRAALKAFDKPISRIARAVEDGDIDFLTGLYGIGKQKAKHIVASLQGKVGRFVLLKEEKEGETLSLPERARELKAEAGQILRRLQYNPKEIDSMVDKALKSRPEINTVEELLNSIYYGKPS